MLICLVKNHKNVLQSVYRATIKTWSSSSIPKKNYSALTRTLKISNRVVSARTFFFRKPSEIVYKRTDEIPEVFNLIYKTNIDNYIKWGYLTACIASAVLLGALFLMYDSQTNQIILSSSQPQIISDDFIICSVLFIICFMAIHFFVTRVPVRIYNMPSQKKYIFVTNGTIPFTIKKITCRKGQLVKEQSTGILADIVPWRNTKYTMLNSHSIFLFEDNFSRPADLHILLGEQDEDCD